MMKCDHCGKEVEIECGRALVPTGFWLYDCVSDKDIPDMDSCNVYMCPHDKEPVRYSKMLHPMGSMGEDAHDARWDDMEGDPF